jgi:predicted phosphodiesterase
VGIIGDVHGEDAALEAVLRFFAAKGPFDALLCTGDVPAKEDAGNTGRCIELLMDAGITTIRGNHDRWFFENQHYRERLSEDAANLTLEQRTWLATLPKTREFPTPRGPLYLCHGLGEKDMEGIYPGGDDDAILQALEWREIVPRCAFMVAGHTHYRMVRKIGPITVINPGTLRWEEKPGFAIADFAEGTVRFYNLTPFTNEITPAGQPS